MDLSRVVASSRVEVTNTAQIFCRGRGAPPCWSGHAAGSWEAKDWFYRHFLPKAIAGKTEQNTQCVNKDLHCIICAKKLTQSSPLQYKLEFICNSPLQVGNPKKLTSGENCFF